jgi:hypothetical protein
MVLPWLEASEVTPTVVQDVAPVKKRRSRVGTNNINMFTKVFRGGQEEFDLSPFNLHFSHLRNSQSLNLKNNDDRNRNDIG